jgi:Quinolinate synthetase A protein.
LKSLQNNQYEIEIPEESRVRAVKSIQRMLAIG